jgi:hypothetical protein
MALAAFLIAVCAFEGPWSRQLAHAHASATAATQCLTQHGEDDARRVLQSELSRTEGRWVSYADARLVSIALLSSTEELSAAGMEHEGELDGHHPAVLSLVCSPTDDVYAFASLDGGAHVVRRRVDGGEQTSAAQIGSASRHANVLHLPRDSGPCAPLDAMLTHLTEMGLGMPLEIVRGQGGDVGEGLLDVLLGTADVHISPPSRFLAREACPPPPVLCAFELLLREAGGVLSDVYGEPIDLQAEVGARLYSSSGVGAVRSAVPLRGLMATEEHMAPYFARATRASFPAAKGEIDAFLDQLRLEDKFSKGFAGEAKIVDEQGYELRNPTPDPNQPRL